jgi:hypothetical protein
MLKLRNSVTVPLRTRMMLQLRTKYTLISVEMLEELVINIKRKLSQCRLLNLVLHETLLPRLKVFERASQNEALWK